MVSFRELLKHKHKHKPKSSEPYTPPATPPVQYAPSTPPPQIQYTPATPPQEQDAVLQPPPPPKQSPVPKPPPEEFSQAWFQQRDMEIGNIIRTTVMATRPADLKAKQDRILRDAQKAMRSLEDVVFKPERIGKYVTGEEYEKRKMDKELEEAKRKWNVAQGELREEWPVLFEFEDVAVREV